MNFCMVSYLLLFWPTATLQRSYYDSPSYMAAIVEYSPIVNSTNEEDLSEVNARNYLKIINKAINYGIDVIVFPENSISISLSKNATIKRSQATSYIPDPTDKIVPCNVETEKYKYSLKIISCAARKHQIYIVIDHGEKVECTPGKGCPADGFLIYNTNVAFDRNGRVIARYRKYNLFDEPEINVTKPIPTTFKTDFGVTFGTFICFDLVFETPALNLTRDIGVTDILYSTHWYDMPPFLYAVEAQAAWAYANDVNFLGSGLSYPKTGSGGSGIYLGKQGYIDVVSNNRRSNILVIAEIPKLMNGKRTRNIDRNKVHVYEFSNEEINTSEAIEHSKWVHLPLNLTDYSTELIDLRKKRHQKNICNNGLCCDFKLTVDFDQNSVKKDSKYYRYRLAVLNGTLVLSGIGILGIKSCGIVSCINETTSSCGHLFQKDDNPITPATFMSLEISTQNIPNDKTFFMPATMSQKIIPLNATHFNFESANLGEVSKYHMYLKRPVNNILSLAILGRNFALDDVHNSNST